ncbi:M28 family peptidase [Dyella sp. AtDHG13]|uniref:M28 family peptidase n=1 Tax=Dyella sp. AtDHG13 TaxID=1938897 RepID=UPI001313E9B0|nr:M28 family peptidase [Dyella sp. AtDHG13]
MRSRSAALLGLALLNLVSQAKAVASASDFDVERLRQDTKYLASDQLGGRMPGTPQAADAVEYIRAQMKRAGLEPGYHGRWIQDVPLVTLTPATSPVLEVTSDHGSLRLNQGSDVVVWTKTPKSLVSLHDSEMVFVGYGIVAPDAGWDDYKGADVRGKTVVMLVNDPDWQSSDSTGPFGGKRLSYYGRYTYKFEEAARHGANAALIIHRTDAAGYPFKVLVNTNAGPKVQIDDPSDPKDHASVEGWISQSSAKDVFDLAGLDLEAQMSNAGTREFHPVPMQLHASVTLKNTISKFKSENVVGILPGQSDPSEAFFFSAHWDHLGTCEPASLGHRICNGAVDNASGVAGVLSLARSFASSPKLRRSVLFIAFTGEEQGLLGSAYYVKHPALPLSDTVGGINIDVMNVFGPTNDVMILHPGLTTLEAPFIATATKQGRKLSPDAFPEQGLYYRSDQLSFARAGVPTLFASSGFQRRTTSNTGMTLAYYFQHVYHTPADTFDPNWDWTGAIEDLEVYRAVGRAFASGGERPTWLPGSEFGFPNSTRKPVTDVHKDLLPNL